MELYKPNAYINRYLVTIYIQTMLKLNKLNEVYKYKAGKIVQNVMFSYDG